MKKLTTLFLALASLCAAQTTYQYSLYNSGAICSLPGGMPTPGCLPPELWKAGVWLTLHNDDPKVFGFYVTISVTLADGSISTQEQFTKRMATGSGVGYANALFWFGKTPSDFVLPPTKISVMDVPFGPSVEQASPAAGVQYQAALPVEPAHAIAHIVFNGNCGPIQALGDECLAVEFDGCVRAVQCPKGK